MNVMLKLKLHVSYSLQRSLALRRQRCLHSSQFSWALELMELKRQYCTLYTKRQQCFRPVVPLQNVFMKPFKCSICGKTFDVSSNARRHVAARGSCLRENAVVQRTNVVIRASDRVVGGREHVEDYGVPSRRVPSVEDDEPRPSSIEPAGDIHPVEEMERTELEGF